MDTIQIKNIKFDIFMIFHIDNHVWNTNFLAVFHACEFGKNDIRSNDHKKKEGNYRHRCAIIKSKSNKTVIQIHLR